MNKHDEALQAFKDEVSRAAHGMTKAEALEKGAALNARNQTRSHAVTPKQGNANFRHVRGMF